MRGKARVSAQASLQLIVFTLLYQTGQERTMIPQSLLKLSQSVLPAVF